MAWFSLAIFLWPLLLALLALPIVCVYNAYRSPSIEGIRIIFFTYPAEIDDMQLPAGTKVRLEYPRGEKGIVFLFQPGRITIDLPEGEDIIYEREGELWRRLAADAISVPRDLPRLGRVEEKDAEEFRRYARKFGKPVPSLP